MQEIRELADGGREGRLLDPDKSTQRCGETKIREENHLKKRKRGVGD